MVVLSCILHTKCVCLLLPTEKQIVLLFHRYRCFVVLNFEGHNRAGESTTISMLVDLLTPTSGDSSVFGKNIITDMVSCLFSDYLSILFSLHSIWWLSTRRAKITGRVVGCTYNFNFFLVWMVIITQSPCKIRMFLLLAA